MAGTAGGVARPGDWWGSRTARASQYVAVPAAGVGASGASPERLDSSAAVAFRCRPAATPLSVPPLSPAILAILTGRVVTGFWLTNSARISRQKPDRNEPGGGSLDSSGGWRTNASDDSGVESLALPSSREPHWWQYEWSGGFSLAHWRQTIATVLLLSRGLGPALPDRI